MAQAFQNKVTDLLDEIQDTTSPNIIYTSKYYEVSLINLDRL